MIELNQIDDGVLFYVRVVPRASRSAIVGEHAGALKLRIAAPPVDGAANAELVKFLAKKLKVQQRDIEIVSGGTGKLKLVRVSGLSESQFKERLSL